MTGVVPTRKVLPGCLSGFWMETPELSVDVGSCQSTTVPVAPKGTVTVMSSGKEVTSGGVESAVEWLKKKKAE